MAITVVKNLAIIEDSQGEIQVNIVDIGRNGNRLDIRRFYLDENEQSQPTKKGIMLSAGTLPVILRAIQDGIQEIDEQEKKEK